MFFERNIVEKNPLKVNIRFASVYPNLYRTAMSSLGYQIIYGMVNEREDTWCERVIYPNTRSIESNSPLRDFDIVSFTIQYEEDYFNVLEILKKSKIPLRKEDRDDSHPLIIAGGPSPSANPLPISDFIDVFIVGEAEAILNKFLDCYQEVKNPKKELNSFLDIKGVYIYDNPVKRAIVKDMSKAYHISQPIVTETDNPDYIPVFGNSILLNVSRGCNRGCRFCMSGYTCRPQRETPLKQLIKIAKTARENTDIKKVSLIAPAVSDYYKIDELTKKLLDLDFQVSTSSLRVESTSQDTLENLRESGLKTITIAPESIYTLRKSLNKHMTNEKIEELIKTAIELNFNIKMYFLIGLLNEEKKDIKELAEYMKEINGLKSKYSNLNKDSNSKTKDSNSKANKKQNQIKFSVNPLIPKAHTPLQWEGYNLKDIRSKERFLKKELKNLNIKFNSSKMGLIQYVLSCKGREIGELIEKTTNNRLLPNENKDTLNLNQWKKFTNGYIEEGNLIDDLPWKNIDNGVDIEFLKKERSKMTKNH
ncbi:MAG: radical SAM protein [Methanobrevibacter sp.]|jgi:radical SAM superfamily enzyme YgiQ (UPF0313 family)|nr:radical SAM protein [Methanobrevibacter sp.]